MPRFTDSVAQPGVGPAAFTNATMVNTLTGGYHGFTANLARYVDNASFRQQQLICIVLETPGFIAHLDHPEIWHGNIKTMMEKHSRTITGFQRALQVEEISQTAGGAGAMHQDPSNVTQQQPAPNHEIDEKYGFPHGTTLEWWIRLGIMDQDAKVPLIMTYPNPPKDLLPDMYSMTCLYIEPDPTHLKVINSYLMVNMWPKGSGVRESRRDKSSGPGLVTHSIEWAGTAIMNYAVDLMAERFLVDMRLQDANPHTQDLPDRFKNPTADVDATGHGFREDIGKTRAEQVRSQ